MLKLKINPYICDVNILMKTAFNPEKIILSSFLTVVLILPYLGAFSHMFVDHEHKTCEISQTHLHKLELDCDILDYQFAPRIEISFLIHDIFIYSFHQNKLPFFNQGDSFSIDIHYSLRGPPSV